MINFPETHFDVVRFRKFSYILSAAVVLGTITSVAVHRGFRLGVEFTGGSNVQVRFSTLPSMDELRKALARPDFPDVELQSLPAQNGVIVRSKESAAKEIAERIVDALSEAFPGNAVTLDRASIVGPAVSRHLFQKALLALVLSLGGIMLYVGFRFRSIIWGAAAVIALIHDMIGAAGIMSVLDREITLPVVAAILTVAGSSINDTIVVFDRMRERIRLRRKESVEELINRSVNETFARATTTNVLVLLAVLALYFFGGPVIRDFSIAMFFGELIGSYSSILLSPALMYEWYTRKGHTQAVPL